MLLWSRLYDARDAVEWRDEFAANGTSVHFLTRNWLGTKGPSEASEPGEASPRVFTRGVFNVTVPRFPCNE